MKYTYIYINIKARLSKTELKLFNKQIKFVINEDEELTYLLTYSVKVDSQSCSYVIMTSYSYYIFFYFHLFIL